MELEIQQVNYVETTSTEEQRADYAQMNVGYGILSQYTVDPGITILGSNQGFGHISGGDEIITSMLHHGMTFAAGDAAGTPFPFATFPEVRRWEEDSQTWLVLALYLHDVPEDELQRIVDATG
jgi:hypothetical protein